MRDYNSWTTEELRAGITSGRIGPENKRDAHAELERRQTAERAEEAERIAEIEASQMDVANRAAAAAERSADAAERSARKANTHANRANAIALAALIVAIASTLIALFRGPFGG